MLLMLLMLMRIIEIVQERFCGYWNMFLGKYSINRALFGQRLHIFGNKVVGYVWMNVVQTYSDEFS
jgi:hypothetical protein